MERSCGQHEAKCVKAGRYFIRQLLWTVSAQQDNWSLCACELKLLFGTHGAIAANNRGIARHQRKRLSRAPFQPAQSRNRFGIAGVTSQLVAANAFYGDD